MTYGMSEANEGEGGEGRPEPAPILSASRRLGGGATPAAMVLLFANNQHLVVPAIWKAIDDPVTFTNPTNSLPITTTCKSAAESDPANCSKGW